jgi:hypothetical protein
MNIWINLFLPIKLILMLRYLFGMLLFSWTLPKKEHYWGRALSWSLLCVLIAVGLPILTEATFYITSLFLLESLLAMCVIRFCCKTEWSTTLYIAAAVFSAEHIASMTDSLISMLNPAVLKYQGLESISPLLYINWILALFAVYALVYFFMFSDNKINGEHSLDTRAMLTLLIASVMVNLYLNIYYDSLVGEKTGWSGVYEYGLNIVISVSLLLVQYGVLRQNQTENRLQMVSMLFEQAREQYRISKENVEAINIKCHDLKHQLLAVKDKTDEKEYTHMMELLDSYGAEIKTNNEVLDVVFQEKNFQCRKLGIQFTCIIDGPALDFMETIDLYVLFGNLIDNCIEAVSQLPETEVKNIQVTVRRDKGFVIVTTENGYEGELHWKDGRPATSKEDQQNHGFGILSIEKIIHKYGGRYSIQTDNNIFVMDIVFPVNMEKN